MIQYLETHLSEIQLSIISIVLVITITVFSLKIFSYLFNNIKKLYTKRKLSIDYIALESLEKPTKVLITFFGFYFCIRLFFGIENIEKYNNLFSSIFYVSLIIIIYWYLQRITTLIEKRYAQRKNADKTLINAIAKVSRLSITIITLLVIFQTIGINIAGILAFGGVGGLAVGMAAKEMLSNFFGGLTIYFNNPVFIYIKPTIINVLFGLALIFGKYFTNEPVLKKLMGKSVSLTNEGWEILNKRWVYFFFGLAILNELVWRTQSEEFWVNFKVWGLLPITFIFTGFQIGLINKYKTNE